MPVDKDYGLSLTRGLCNTFQTKYLRAAFDLIKELVKDEETVPKTDADLEKFAEKIVNEALNEKFRLRLIDQVRRSIRDAPPNKQAKTVKDLDRDYVLSLNKGLFNEFQNKYVQDAFDEITNIVTAEEALPETDAGLAKFSAKVVDEAFDSIFRRRLVKQVMRSIKNAPPKDF